MEPQSLLSHASRPQQTGARRRLGRVGLIIAVVGLALSVLFLLWAAFGVRSVREALVEETERHSLALLQSLILASQYSLTSGTLVDQLERETLAERARTVLERYADDRLKESDLDSLVTILDVDEISLRASGQWLATSPEAPIVGDTLELGDEPLAISIADTLSERKWSGIGFGTSQGEVVAWRVTDARAAQPAIGGVGELIQEIGRQSGVNYIMLQAPDGIVFASRPLKPVLKIAADSFLVAVLEANSADTREILFEGTPVLEAAAPFLSNELPSGMFRVGLSLNAVDDAVNRLTLQLGLTALLLILLSTTAISIVVTRRSLADLGQSYREVETLSGSVFDAIDQAVIAVDAEGRITIINPTAERWFGVATREVRGQLIGVLLPDDFDLEDVRRNRVAIAEREIGCKTARGMRTFVYSTAPLVTSDTKHVGAVAVIRDETESRAMAIQVRRAERLSAMGQLAAGVAHEIRNPLNAIALAAQQLKMELGSAAASDMADTIWSESKRLNGIVEDFLSLARPSTLPKETIELHELINSVTQMAMLESDKKAVGLRVDMEGTCRISGVADELRKALWNLLRNALAATEPGGRINVTLREERGQAILTIDDTGSGIAPEAIARVFEPWFTTKSGGTGLGLAITYRIVQDHDGTIEVNSPVPGTYTGTRVVVRIPLTEVV